MEFSRFEVTNVPHKLCVKKHILVLRRTWWNSIASIHFAVFSKQNCS